MDTCVSLSFSIPIFPNLFVNFHFCQTFFQKWFWLPYLISPAALHRFIGGNASGSLLKSESSNAMLKSHCSSVSTRRTLKGVLLHGADTQSMQPASATLEALWLPLSRDGCHLVAILSSIISEWMKVHTYSYRFYKRDEELLVFANGPLLLHIGCTL